MRILYGVQGTGNGHITRARHMAKALGNRQGVTVDYFFSGRSADKYFDMEVFQDYSTARGLTFNTANGKILYAQTITQNNLWQFVKDVRQALISDYDLVINDFEPVTAWSAKLSGVPSISVSHQAAFLHRVPKHQQGLIDKALTKYFAPTDMSLGTHWYHFGHDIIPPFISSELARQAQTQQTTSEDFLVYLPFESCDVIREQLQILSEHKFICFHPNVQEPERDKNIHWQPLSTDAFKQKLLRCSGVISNCGFELSTECLALGKPLLVKPLNGQYEQLSNAFTLQQFGASSVMHKVDADDIDEWINQKHAVKIDYPTNCDALIDWLVDGRWDNPKAMCQTLWQDVGFPSKVKKRLIELTQPA